MSTEEISRFCNHISALVKEKCYAEGFQKAADKAAQMVPLFELWQYNAYVAPLEIAVKKQDADETIRLLRGLLKAAELPWDMASSPLFCRIQKMPAEKTSQPALLPLRDILHLRRIQPVIIPLLLHQFAVRTAFEDTALVYVHDPVTVFNGR